jgi:HK97 gp10 family phage protein
MEISIDTSQVMSNLDGAAAYLQAALRQGITQGCLVVEGAAKSLCPVDEGELRDSIQNKIEEDQGEFIGKIGTNKPYGIYVEMGTGLYASNGNGRKSPWFYKDRKGKGHWTWGSRPQPFLYPALVQNQDKVKAVMIKHLKDVLK